VSLLVKIDGKYALPICPLFFANSYKYINFLSQLNKKKKWESGQKLKKPLIHKDFFKPTFVFESGQKVGKWAEKLGKTVHSHSTTRKNSAKYPQVCPEKWAMPVFPNSKVGKKEEALLSLLLVPRVFGFLFFVKFPSAARAMRNRQCDNIVFVVNIHARIDFPGSILIVVNKDLQSDLSELSFSEHNVRNVSYQHCAVASLNVTNFTHFMKTSFFGFIIRVAICAQNITLPSPDSPPP
jgi:hypothetical protein